MTAQIGDRFYFGNNEYSIVAKSEPLRFDPCEYGITPEAACTACWAGYWCEYSITDDGIFLEKLFINSSDGKYPPINGIVPSAKKNRLVYMGHELYDGLHIKMNYTGKILVGKDFLHQYYIHMGYQRAWAYETLVEFVFENGTLTEQNDQSKIAAQIREYLNKNTDSPADRAKAFAGIAAFVEDSFSLDYKTKAWWL